MEKKKKSVSQGLIPWDKQGKYSVHKKNIIKRKKNKIKINKRKKKLLRWALLNSGDVIRRLMTMK